MSTVTFHRRIKPTGRVKPKTGRTSVTVLDVIAASVIVIRPVCVSVALIAAAVTWSTHARADNGDPGSPFSPVGPGGPGGGSISSSIAEVGTAFCPMLVQPGSNLASTATEVSGHGGLAPPIAGWLAGMAIQTQCPGFMTRLANGDLSGLPGVGNVVPDFGTPGTNPLVPNQLGVPGF